MFLSILKTCGIIHPKKVKTLMTISVIKDQWISFISQYELNKVEIIKSKVSVVDNDKHSRRDMTCIRIGTKSTSSYTKVTTHFNLHFLPLSIKIRQLSCNFLNTMSTDILEMMHWSKDKCIHD